MRDGQGNKLSPEEEHKVKSTKVEPDKESLNRVSIDPGPNMKPIGEAGKQPEPPKTSTPPKF